MIYIYRVKVLIHLKYDNGEINLKLWVLIYYFFYNAVILIAILEIKIKGRVQFVIMKKGLIFNIFNKAAEV